MRSLMCSGDEDRKSKISKIQLMWIFYMQHKTIVLIVLTDYKQDKNSLQWAIVGRKRYEIKLV